MKFFTLYKQAGPQDKIRKYKVTDKYQQLFILKHENLIDWELFEKRSRTGVNSKLLLDSFIHEELVEFIKNADTQNSTNPYFLKPEDIDLEREIDAVLGQPQAQQFVAFCRKNPEEAKNKLAAESNNRKKKTYKTGLQKYKNFTAIILRFSI
jgi:hypothetical protein